MRDAVPLALAASAFLAAAPGCIPQQTVYVSNGGGHAGDKAALEAEVRSKIQTKIVGIENNELRPD